MIEAIFLIAVLAVVIHIVFHIRRRLNEYGVRRDAGFFDSDEERQAYEAAEAKVIKGSSPSAWVETEDE